MAKEIKEAKTIKYGKIEVPINDGQSQYAPQTASKFIDHQEIMKTLAIAVRDNLPVLLSGESGVGKTASIRYLANQTKNGLRRVNLNGGTTADELVGRLLINDKGTYWVDGVLTEAMRRGEWIVLDEINAALPEVLFVLQSVLDDDGYLVLTEKDDKEIVHKHPNFRLFATCNPLDYAGTKEMNKALLSRFAICIHVEYPPEKTELEIIENHLGNAVAQSEVALKLVQLANKTRADKEIPSTGVTYAINTRDILNTLKLCENVDPLESLLLSFGNKLENDDKSSLKTTARLYLPTKKKANATRNMVSSIDKLEIGASYVLDKDIHNAYFAMSSDKDAYEKMVAGEIAEVIGSGRQDAIKNDEFTIEAFFWENQDESSKTEIRNAGSKIGSAIKITAGPNKGKCGFIMHHADLDNTANIINNIFEIK